MKKIFSLIGIGLLAGVNAFGQAALETSDTYTLEGFWDEDGEELTEVQVNGVLQGLTVGLDGDNDDPDRLYTAYNLDITFPYGFEVTKEDDVYDVYLNYDSDIYPYTGKKTKTYTHTISGNWRNGNTIRIACYSSSNQDLLGQTGNLFDVYFQATSPYVKPGLNKLSFSGMKLVITEGSQGYKPADMDKEFTVEEATMSVDVNIGAGRWGTLLLPFDQNVPAGMQAFTCGSVQDGKVKATAVSQMEAYKPYLVYSETGYSATLSGKNSATKYEAAVSASGYSENGILSGAVTPQTISTG